MTTDSGSAGHDDVTEFYDVADYILTTIWGGNFHSGYWESEDDDSSNEEAVRRLNELLIDKVAASPGQRVLDVGSGLGEPTFLLAQRSGASAVGVTIAQPQVDEANRRARALGLDGQVSFENADGQALPHPDASFDAALVIESFIHMDRARALKEIARVLKPGGRVVIADLVQPDSDTGDTEQAREEMSDTMALTEMPTIAGYRRLIADTGLNVVEILDITKHTKKTSERMAEAARQHYDELVAERGQEAAEVLDMLMTSFEVGYVVVVAELPPASS